MVDAVPFSFSVLSGRTRKRTKMRAMGIRSLLAAALLLVPLVGGACAPDEFLCKRDPECVGGHGEFGLCLDQHCAFRDTGCTGGFRWDDSAGSQANMCADPQTVGGHLDAGVGPDAPVGVPDAPLQMADARAADAGAADAPAPDGP